MFCTECGTKFSEGAKFCSNCGTEILVVKNVEDLKSGKSRLDKERAYGKEFKNDPDPSLVDEITFFEYESPLKTGLLLVVTLGFYYLVLLNKWIKAINAVSKKDFCDPTVAIIITIVTLGFAAIYFDYQILVRAEKLAKSTNGKSNPKRKNLTPPVENLKELVLFGSVFVSIAQFTPAIIISLIIMVNINLSIQRALEYTFYTQNPN